MSPSRHLPPLTLHLGVSKPSQHHTTSSVKHPSPDYARAAHVSPCDATCYPLVPTCDRWHVMLSLTADMCTGDLNAVMLKRSHETNCGTYGRASLLYWGCICWVDERAEKCLALMTIITGNCYHGMNNHLKWPILIRFQGQMIGMPRQFDMRCADVPACRIRTGCQRLSGSPQIFEALSSFIGTW